MSLSARGWGVKLLCCCSLLTSPAAAQTLSKDQCIDANEAAQTLQKDGDIPAARVQLELCLHPECPAPVRADCQQLLSTIESSLASVVFDARDAKGTRVTEVQVTIDGKPLASRLDGTPLAVEPGSHRFEFVSLGNPKTNEQLFLTAGEHRLLRVDLVDKTGPLLRTAGIVTAGVGVLALSFGAYGALQAKGTYDDAEEHCPSGPSSCDAAGVSGGKRAHDQAATATTAFVLGGVLLAGGATMYWFGSKMNVSAVTTSKADGAGMLIRGTW
jgi:hypothetical protein